MFTRLSSQLLLLTLALGCVRPEETPAQEALRRYVTNKDTAVARALLALAEQRPWRATRALEPVLGTPTRRTADAVLLAAAAAGEWRGWSRVDSLLQGERWVDSAFDGAGMELLARAALARRVDTLAAQRAERALARAAGPTDRGVRRVLLARALDRLALGDSAAAMYARAAVELPTVADWLFLRAAGVSASAPVRQSFYGRVRGQVARARIPPSEAQALERWGEAAAAAAAYARLGAVASVLRLRLVADTSRTARDSVRRSAVAALSAASPDDARALTDLLDREFAPLTPAEELAVARSTSATGPLGRSVAAFERAGESGTISAEDRYAYARTLMRLDRHREAASQFARVERSSALAAMAAFDRARALLRSGDAALARRALLSIESTFPTDTQAVAGAAFLLADLAADAGEEAQARRGFLRLGERYPTSSFAPSARFRAAIIAYITGDARAAARELDTLLTKYPASVEVLAAGYWSGRAWERVGDRTQAGSRWRAVIAKEPLSFYSVASRRRLADTSFSPPRGPAASLPAPLDSAVQRAALLSRLGMDTEESLEFDALRRAAADSSERVLATAQAFLARGLASPAIQLARRVLFSSTPETRTDTRAYRLAYPLLFGDAIRAEARARQLDPALVAGLILQESSFTPEATSRAGALGVMQVLPSVGRRIALSLGYPFWDRVLLYQPDVSIELGTTHLATMLRSYPDVAYALAAYNAGGSPVRRWRALPGAGDPELFIERIAYDETRDYVRSVLRNREIYRALYDW